MSSRRDFIKASAVVATTAAAANYASRAFAAGNDTIKVGLIGCGGRGNGAVKDILTADDKVEIVAFGDVFEGKAKSAQANWKRNKQFSGRVTATPDAAFGGLDAYQKVLNAGVDLVILATPPGFRPYHLEAAVKANKHIFCEKPVAVDAAGIRKCLSLVEESKKNGKALVAGTQRRHQKGYIETVGKIQAGEIGDVIAARCSWNGQGIWYRERAEGQADAEYQLNNWYHYLWLCGDHIVEQHVHNLDVINWVMNAHPVKAVAMGGRATRDALIANQLKKNPRLKGTPVGDPGEYGNIWDHFAVEYEYPNGVKLFSYCEHIAGSKSDVSETVYGSKGTCRVNAYAVGKKRIGEDNDVSAYVQEHVDMIQSIRAGKPLNELQSVTESTFTAILGRDAAYSGKELTWDGLLKGGKSTMPEGLALGMKVPVTPAPVPGQGQIA
jgi:predicted dehydrogenase